MLPPSYVAAYGSSVAFSGKLFLEARFIRMFAVVGR
jgi:hypothetical protein